ncbi:MAG: phenylalanine--tRNA ligase beta subunit-related protein [Bilophila wadsworthia]
MHKERTCRPSTSPSIHPSGAWPEARLGCFIYTADVRAREDSLWTCLENEVAPYLKTMLETTPLAQIPNLDESRKAYKAFSRTRTLPRFVRIAVPPVRQGKALYQINSVVDANNLVSLETGFSLGSYDTARIGADIVFRLGKAGEVYPGIARTTSRSKAPARRRKARSEAPPATLPAP